MTYIGAVERRICFGDEPLDSCFNSSGWDHFEPTPCSWAEGLISLASKGAAAEPPLSVSTSGAAIDPPAPISSWGVAVEPLPSTGTLGMVVDPSAPTGPKDGLMVWPVFAGLTDSLPPA